jgi:hypothetical protein
VSNLLQKSRYLHLISNTGCLKTHLGVIVDQIVHGGTKICQNEEGVVQFVVERDLVSVVVMETQYTEDEVRRVELGGNVTDLVHIEVMRTTL